LSDIVTGLDEGARISRTVADAALVGGGPLGDAEIRQRLSPALKELAAAI